MALITSITAQKRSKERFNIYLDDKYAFPISMGVFLDWGIKKGMELSEEDIRDIIVADSFDKIYGKVLHFVAYQHRTKKEISTKLFKLFFKYEILEGLRKSFSEKIFKKLDDLDLLSDEYYAQTYVKNKMNSTKPPSKQKLREFLMKKGISNDLIVSALELYPADIEKDGALLQGKKKLKSLKKVNKKTKKNKLWRYLAGRGYSPDVIGSVVDTLVQLD